MLISSVIKGGKIFDLGFVSLPEEYDNNLVQIHRRFVVCALYQLY